MILKAMKEENKSEVFSMMREFYNSPAVLHHASDEILKRDINHCIGDCPFIEGYVIEIDEKVVGYSMIAKSYSTEYACSCIWIEDLYLVSSYRGKGIGTKFFQKLEEIYSENPIRFRLEVEPENEAAVTLYKKMGYETLSYMEMTKEVE